MKAKTKPKPPKAWKEPVYHLLDLRNEACSYRGGYADKDALMLYACFNLFQKFVEEERPFDAINWKTSPDRQLAEKEIKDLYAWWMKDRKRQAAEIEAQWAKIKWRDLLGGIGRSIKPRQKSGKPKPLPRYVEDLDAEMLQRLMKIRRYLWT